MVDGVSPKGRKLEHLDGSADLVQSRAFQIRDVGQRMIDSATKLDRFIKHGAENMSGQAVSKLSFHAGQVRKDLRSAGDVYQSLAPHLDDYGDALETKRTPMNDLVDEAARAQTLLDEDEQSYAEKRYLDDPSPEHRELLDTLRRNISERIEELDWIGQDWDELYDGWEPKYDAAVNGIRGALDDCPLVATIKAPSGGSGSTPPNVNVAPGGAPPPKVERDTPKVTVDAPPVPSNESASSASDAPAVREVVEGVANHSAESDVTAEQAQIALPKEEEPAVYAELRTGELQWPAEDGVFTDAGRDESKLSFTDERVNESAAFLDEPEELLRFADGLQHLGATLRDWLEGKADAAALAEAILNLIPLESLNALDTGADAEGSNPLTQADAALALEEALSEMSVLDTGNVGDAPEATFGEISAEAQLVDDVLRYATDMGLHELAALVGFDGDKAWELSGLAAAGTAPEDISVLGSFGAP